MVLKKNEMKFTILFSPANPDHVFAANKLNTQSRNNKANYLAQAVKFYEDNNNVLSGNIGKTLISILSGQTIAPQQENTEVDFDKEFTDTINNSLDIFKRI